MLKKVSSGNLKQTKKNAGQRECAFIKIMRVNQTPVFINRFGWNVIEGPTFNSNVFFGDYHLFSSIKIHLSGKKFTSDVEVQEEGLPALCGSNLV